MKTGYLKIRVSIKFWTKLGWKSFLVIDSLHQIYGDSVAHRTTVFRWIKLFKKGQDIFQS